MTITCNFQEILQYFISYDLKTYKWGLSNKLHCAIFSNCRGCVIISYLDHLPYHLDLFKVSYVMRKRGHPYELIEHAEPFKNILVLGCERMHLSLFYTICLS